MKMRQSNWKRGTKKWTAVSLSLLLCAALWRPAPVYAEEAGAGTIQIKTQEE